MTTATRRKYRFKSRELAEEGERIQSHRAHLLYRGLRAVERGEVTWTSRQGRYQIGLYDLDSPSGARCLLRYWGNGKVETDAHDFDEWATWWERYPGSFPSAEDCDLRSLVQAVRRIVYDHENPQPKR